MSKSKKSAAYIVGIVITALFTLCAVAVFTVTLIARSQNKQASFFGYSFSIVLTDSMEPEIKTGSLIIIDNCAISADLLNKNVVFVSTSGLLEGERIVHHVIAVDADENGDISLTTKGVNENAAVDGEPVTAENFVGVAVWSSYALGKAVSFISQYAVPIVIAVIAVPIIIRQIKVIIQAVKEKTDDE